MRLLTFLGLLLAPWWAGAATFQVPIASTGGSGGAVTGAYGATWPITLTGTNIGANTNFAILSKDGKGTNTDFYGNIELLTGGLFVTDTSSFSNIVTIVELQLPGYPNVNDELDALQGKQNGTSLLTNLSLSGVTYLSTNDSFTLSLSNAPNDSVLVFGNGTYPVTPSILDSNFVTGTMFQGAKLYNKTNLTLIGNGSLVDGSSGLGQLLFISNCSNIRIEGFTFRGMTNHNPALLPPFTGTGANLWSGVELYASERVTFSKLRVERHADHGIQDRGAQATNSGQITATRIISTNQIYVLNCAFEDIGGARTNAGAGTVSVDGTAIVSTGWTIDGNAFVDLLRGVEPYNESDAESAQFYNCRIVNNYFLNNADAAITCAGSTNGNNILVANNHIEWTPGATYHGTSLFTGGFNGRYAQGIAINGGFGHNIIGNTIRNVPGEGIATYASSSALREFSIVNNLIDGATNTTTTAYPIILGYSGGTAGSSARNFYLSKNVIKNAKTYALYAFSVSDSTFEDNQFLSPIFPGLPSPALNLVKSTGYTSNNLIRGNFFSDQRGVMTYGIQLGSGVLNTTLDGNKIQGFATGPINDGAAAGQTKYRSQLNAAGIIQNDETNSFGVVRVTDDAYAAGWNGSTDVPTKNALYDKIETISGGSGGTNFPAVLLQAGNTNLALQAGKRTIHSFSTNGAHGVDADLAVPASGHAFSVIETNSSGANYTVTFYTNGVAATFYDIATKTNATSWVVPLGSVVENEFLYTAAGWFRTHFAGPELVPVAGTGITFTTNGVNGLNLVISATGSGTPGGSSSAIQFNEGSSFAGTNQLMYDRAANDLIVVGTAASATNGARAGLIATNTVGERVEMHSRGFSSSSFFDFSLGTASEFYGTNVALLAQTYFAPAVTNSMDSGLWSTPWKTSYANQFEAKVGVNAPSITVNQITTTNSIRHVANTVTGVGGANTNFTFQSSGPVTYVNAGTTNVNIVAVMGGTAGLPVFKTIVFTNLTTTSRQLSRSTVTNAWFNLNTYAGLVFPMTITNQHRLVMAMMVDGTNVTVGSQIVTNGF